MTEAVYQLLIILALGILAAAFITPILVALNYRNIRDWLLSTRVTNVPGFRSGTNWKVVVSVFCYLFVLGIFVVTVASLLTIGGGPEVMEASLESDKVKSGEPVTISAVVENGVGPDSIEVMFESEGSIRETRTFEIGSSETRTITFEHVFDEAGEYQVKIGSKVAGTVSVQSSNGGGVSTTTTATVTSTPTTSDKTGTPTTTEQTTSTEETDQPVSPPEDVPGYSVVQVRDVSFGSTERRAIDVTVEGDLEDYSRQELFKISRDIVFGYVNEVGDVNAIAMHFWQDSSSMGTAYATVMWAPNGEWSEANSVQTGSYSSHEFSIEGDPYFEFVDIQAPEEVTVGENFTITMTIRNGGIGEGEASGWFEDIDDNTYANFDVELAPGEQTTVTKTVTIEEYPTLGEKTLYFTSFSRVIHNSSSISINVTKAS